MYSDSKLDARIINHVTAKCRNLWGKCQLNDHKNAWISRPIFPTFRTMSDICQMLTLVIFQSSTFT